MIVSMNSPERPTRHSLWRELADGTVRTGVRVLVNIALAVFLTGAACLITFFAAALVPAFRHDRSYGFYPTDELAIAVFMTAALAFVGGTAWLWSRKSRHRALLRPALWTLGIAAVTTLVAAIAADAFRWAEEFVVPGVVLLGGAGAMMIWINAWFQMSRGRPMQNEQDGLPDIRCPKCGYRMVGLREARCPECGESYTLDELLGRQDFSWPAQGAEPVREANRAG
jgi:uncharacterized OB-fold protein